MNTNVPVDEVMFKFGTFELFPARRLLLKGGRLVKLGSRAFDLLVALVENAGRVIAKDELISVVWSNVVVEDTNLRVHIAALRRLLGDDGLESRYIVHAARRGYVFVVPISVTTRLIVRPESICGGAPQSSFYRILSATHRSGSRQLSGVIGGGPDA